MLERFDSEIVDIPPSRTVAYSVIVPAYNSAADLGACLDSILAALPPHGEVLVVDDGSKDRTSQIAASYPVTLLRHIESLGPAAARNLAASQARGGILVFIDSDVQVRPGAIDALLARLASDPSLDAVFGSYDEEPTHTQFVSQFRNLLHHHTHQRAKQEASTFWTGCGAVRRASFEKAGGFDAGRRWIEDVDLGLRIKQAGGRIAADPTIQATHRKRWTLTSMVHTDVFGRAVPWMRLVDSHGGLQDDLNTCWRARWSAVAVCAAIVLACFGLWRLAPVALAAAAAFSAGWHGFLWRRRGAWFALRALPLHWLYLTYCAASYGIMRVLLSFERSSRPCVVGYNQDSSAWQGLKKNSVTILSVSASSSTRKAG